MLEEDLPVPSFLIEYFDFNVILGIINPVGCFGKKT